MKKGGWYVVKEKILVVVARGVLEDKGKLVGKAFNNLLSLKYLILFPHVLFFGPKFCFWGFISNG